MLLPKPRLGATLPCGRGNWSFCIPRYIVRYIEINESSCHKACHKPYWIYKRRPRCDLGLTSGTISHAQTSMAANQSIH